MKFLASTIIDLPGREVSLDVAYNLLDSPLDEVSAGFVLYRAFYLFLTKILNLVWYTELFLCRNSQENILLAFVTD